MPWYTREAGRGADRSAGRKCPSLRNLSPRIEEGPGGRRSRPRRETGGLRDPPSMRFSVGRLALLKMEIEAQLEKMISRFKLGIIIEFVFAVEIFVEKIQRKIRDQFKIHPRDELAGEGRVVFIRVE